MATETTSRLAELQAKLAKLEAEIKGETVKEQANTLLAGMYDRIAGMVTTEAGKAKLDVKVLHGKFFALTVDDAGKLAVKLADKVNGHKGTTAAAAAAAGTTGGDYVYFLADGQGPFDTVQTAMDKMGIDPAKRPNHNRYGRLSNDWKAKILRKDKPAAAAGTPAAAV